MGPIHTRVRFGSSGFLGDNVCRLDQQFDSDAVAYWDVRNVGFCLVLTGNGDRLDLMKQGFRSKRRLRLRDSSGRM
jgi:hypothetical protein